ncbi:uncharacterized protein [Periplaneta americana]|uniref:uncharacterized protein n=1 Tax=Periplaneta americana TaxID=6978 RepID=UPI0037E7CBE4
MDVIKMERELDLLAIERHYNTDIEEQKSLSQQGNVLDLQVTGIKTEYMDHNSDVKAEMTFYDTPVPIVFPIVKSEVEDGNVLDLHVTEIKTECMDRSCDLKSEMTFEEFPVPTDFPIMKSEAEEETLEINKVEKEIRLEVIAEEDEVLSDR